MMIRLPPEEFPAWSRYIYSLCGVYLEATKAYLIETRLSPLLETVQCRNYADLFLKARSDSTGALPRKIVDAITTGETSFFRDASPFELLQHKILPELIDRRTARAGGSGQIPIRIWSAACSTGQEVYSIAMVLKELQLNTPRYALRLLGTDISDKAVATASRGTFGKIEIERGLPPETLRRHFEPNCSTWKIKDEIRAMAAFRTFNLMGDLRTLGRFDIIFCRNVAIYFTESDRAALFARMAAVLEPDGYLIIGSTESIAGLCPMFESKRYLRSTFYQLRRV